MAFSFPVFIVVLLMGIVQLAVGVVFGRYLPPIRSRRRSQAEGDAEHGKLHDFARRLFDLGASMAEDVGRHRSEINQVHQNLKSANLKSTAAADNHSGKDVPPGDGQITELVLESVARIIEVNERLQERLEAAEDRLQKQTEQIKAQFAEARTDPLTGLSNRRAFDDALTRQLAEWRRKRSIFCLCVIDVDRFKNLNDEYGHPAGDQVLQTLAEVLKQTVREMDTVARIGGEEFAVILPSTNAVDACRAVERMRVAVADEDFSFDERAMQVTISLGLTSVATDDKAITLVKRSDEALYKAKQNGRNCGYFHDGQICRRIAMHDAGVDLEMADGSVEPLSDEASVGESTGQVEMAALCNSLRARVDELSRDEE